ncbi:hypothetical protein [Paraburkholderia phytofirmans]|uniref:Uncharacterized protein n=1 Tax=Paraburkholderia phytofirmans TaxID=261302 RepID=A0ABW9BJB5_9BURK|nr:hypothetical protein [Paraburkholderia phytofirmans]
MKRAISNKDQETAILMRMADSRAALVEANSTPRPISGSRELNRSPAAGILASLADAPHVSLVLALSVGAIAFGPRRLVGIAARSGITAWLGRTIHQAISKTA